MWLILKGSEGFPSILSYEFGDEISMVGWGKLQKSAMSLSIGEVYPSSHNHGSEKWVPPMVDTFQL